MKTLFIAYSYLGGHGGGVYAERTHINLFAEVSDHMTLIYPVKLGEEPIGLNVSKIEMIPVEDHRSRGRKFFDLLCGKMHRFQLSEEFFKKEKYDTVVFDNSVVSSKLIKRFKRAGFKIITIHHNYQIQYLLGDGSLVTLLPNLFWTRIYEGTAVKMSDLNITLTTQDIDLLKKSYDPNARFSVLGVFEYQKRAPVLLPDETRSHRYVITGGLGSKQTENSILRWINDYYDELLLQDPEARITIAGSNPSDNLINTLKIKNIDLIASPADMDPILKDADFYLCPVDCGGGLKLRNLDGLKYGLPVLTHKVSLRGYEKMEREGVVFSYATRDQFKESLKQMLSITVSRKEIQRLYLEQYQYEKGVDRLRQILNESGLE